MRRLILLILVFFSCIFAFSFESKKINDPTSDNNYLVIMNQDFRPDLDRKQDISLKKANLKALDYDNSNFAGYKRQKVDNEVINSDNASSSNNSSLKENNETLNLSDIDSLNVTELEKSNIDIEESRQITISLKSPGWIIKSISPPLLKLIKRENLENNSVFTFETGPPANVNIVFLRFDQNTNSILRQPYSINIII